jgi:hypothetical protein
VAVKAARLLLIAVTQRQKMAGRVYVFTMKVHGKIARLAKVPLPPLKNLF